MSIHPTSVISDSAKKENQEIINDLIIAAYNNAKENLKKNQQMSYRKLLEDLTCL
mgnify:CR=1 FL=1